MSSLCRTCLCQLAPHPLGNTLCYNIFETLNLADKLVKCSAMQILPGDNYPHFICYKCHEQIEDICKFQEMCRNSIKKFDEILNASQIGMHMEEAEAEAGAAFPIAENISAINGDVSEGYALKNPLEASQDIVGNKQSDESMPVKAYEIETFENKKEENTQAEDEKVKEKSFGFQLRKRTNKTDLSDSGKSFSDSDAAAAEITRRSSCRLTFQCNICPKQFLVQHRLEAHRRKHEGMPSYTCNHEGCERNFNRWHYYQEHLKQHNSSNEFHRCDIENCDRVYKNKSALNVHKRKYHKCGPELKSHMCEICGKVFKSSAVLNDHRYTHVDRSQLPYVCEEEGCTKRFSNKEKLKIHKMRHAGIKNYTCPHCGMRKTTRNELKIHINYHTLERTWPCHFCSKVCNSAGNLKMHVRNIHERAKDFACRFCDRTFAKADTRKYHEMTHTGEKPHACGECGRRFLQPAALRTHRKIHLKENVRKSTTNWEDNEGSAAIVEVTTDFEVNILETVSQSDKNRDADGLVEKRNRNQRL